MKIQNTYNSSSLLRIFPRRNTPSIIPPPFSFTTSTESQFRFVRTSRCEWRVEGRRGINSIYLFTFVYLFIFFYSFVCLFIYFHFLGWSPPPFPPLHHHPAIPYHSTSPSHLHDVVSYHHPLPVQCLYPKTLPPTPRCHIITINLNVPSILPPSYHPPPPNHQYQYRHTSCQK